MVKIRPVSFLDVDDLYRWRNDPSISEASITGDVEIEEHYRWVQNRIKEKMFWIVEHNDKPIGTVLAQKKDSKYFWSFYVIPEKQGKGYGGLLTKLGLCIINEIAEIQVIHAEVLDSNKKSVYLHEKLGFMRYETEGNIIRYVKELF